MNRNLEIMQMMDPEMAKFQEDLKERHKKADLAFQAVIDRWYKPLIIDLQSFGLDFEDIDILRQSGVDYSSAIPILLRHMQASTNRKFKESVVRALTFPWARPVVAIPLIVEFKKDPTTKGTRSSLRWAIGNALNVVVDDSVFDEVAELLLDRGYGKDREMIALAMRRMKNPRTGEILLSIIDDQTIAGHVIQALRTIGYTKARREIEPYTEHARTWWRNEAKKAIAKFDKIESRKLQND